MARRFVATYRPEDLAASPSMETPRWGLASAIGILRDNPELFDRIRTGSDERAAHDTEISNQRAAELTEARGEIARLQAENAR